VEVIDLRVRGKGCTDHPIIKFTQLLRGLSRSKNKEITIIVSEEDIPFKFIELFTKNHGVRIVDISRLDSKSLTVKLASP